MPESQDPIKTVVAFLNAWEHRDFGAIMAPLSPSVVYENVPRHRMEGRAEVGAFIRSVLADAEKVVLRLDAVALSEDGRSVLTERWDFLHYPGGTVVLPIMGIFVVVGGMIEQWRDYTDGATAGEQFAKVGVNLVLPGHAKAH